MRNARYRLRGVRVGVASNPGPPQTRNRPRVDVAEDILASLEHDLTHIDSDDEPLLRGGSDRNVVPRLDLRSSASGIEDVGIESTAPDSAVFVDPDLPMSPRDSVLDALEHDLVCEGLSSSTVPAPSRAARSISLTQRSGTVHAVSRDALEREVRQSVGPTVVDMSFDDTDQDEEVSMAGKPICGSE